MLRIFTPVKIQRLRPGLNPQTRVPEASMLITRPPKPSKVKVKQSRNRPGVAQRVPGSLGSQISMTFGA